MQGITDQIAKLVDEPAKADKYLKEVKEKQLKQRKRIKISPIRNSPSKQSEATLSHRVMNESPNKTTASVTPNRNISIVEQNENAYGLPQAQTSGFQD